MLQNGTVTSMCEVLSAGHVATTDDVALLISELTHWGGTALIIGRDADFHEVWVDDESELQARVHRDGAYPEQAASIAIRADRSALSQQGHRGRRRHPLTKFMRCAVRVVRVQPPPSIACSR
jgi:hypothetical protein